MLVSPARARRRDYAKPVVEASLPPSKLYTFVAPTRGWVTNENIAAAQPGGASVLDNWWVGNNSIKVRGGAIKWATVHATETCHALFAYIPGSQLFAATETAIYDVSNPADPDVVPSASLTGQTSGDYSSTAFSTAGGDFVLAANNIDRLICYDGATWRRIDTATLELPYDAQTVNYGGGGLTVTGGTSGATGVIVEVIDNGATGTLRLKSVVGTFVDNELVTASTGSATSNIPSGATTVPAITGGDTLFSHVWSFKSRLFFLREGSLTAHCLGTVDAIGGALVDVSLGGILRKGGQLVIGATWSTDAGDGMDDMCVFVSDQGEVAVFQGSDPADANAWGLVGVYNMPVPMHKNAIMKAGGNLLVMTEIGLIPISSAVKKDMAAIIGDAVSLPIEPTWKEYVRARTTANWCLIKWEKEGRAIVGFPRDADDVKACFAVNVQTGAWSRMRGWDIRCGVELNGELYFGTPNGKVMKMESAGSDDGDDYQALYVGLYERLGNVAQEKSCHMARSTWSYSRRFNYLLTFAGDFSYNLGPYPSAASDNVEDVWDTGLWDVAVWDATGVKKVRKAWRSAAGSGFAIAPVVQINIGNTAVPDIELISIDLLYETGTVIT